MSEWVDGGRRTTCACQVHTSIGRRGIGHVFDSQRGAQRDVDLEPEATRSLLLGEQKHVVEEEEVAVLHPALGRVVDVDLAIAMTQSQYSRTYSIERIEGARSLEIDSNIPNESTIRAVGNELLYHGSSIEYTRARSRE